MKRPTMLMGTSLISIVLLSMHVSADIVLGYDKGGLNQLTGMYALVLFLCGTLLFPQRRWGLVLMLLTAIAAAGMPAIHMRGALGVGAEGTRTAGAYVFIWTLYALGITGPFGIILAVRELVLTARKGRMSSQPGQ